MPAPADASFRDYVLDQLAGLPGVEARAMFGGHGLYLHQVFFAIVQRGRLYFRTGPHNRDEYLKRGMAPFTPSAKQVLKNYLEVPADILDDGERLRDWARAAARRAP